MCSSCAQLRETSIAVFERSEIPGPDSSKPRTRGDGQRRAFRSVILGEVSAAPRMYAEFSSCDISNQTIPS
jgi:hypothetical protein